MGGTLSRRLQVLMLIVLLMVPSSLFMATRDAGYPQATAFSAFLTVGLLIALFVVVLSRRDSRRP